MAQDSSYREELHNKILISDTIGFIRNLPPILFETFMATLEEVKEADLLIHVIDVSDSMIEEKIRTVEEILTQMQCHEKPRILVFNKADLVPHAQKLADVVVRYGGDRPFIISALAKDTLHAVKEEVYSRLHLV
jgi:GTP-binding protein HflX